MRNFLLFLAVFCCTAFTTASAQQAACGTFTMNNQSVNGILAEATFDVTLTLANPVTQNSAFVAYIEVTGHDTNQSPSFFTGTGAPPMFWSLNSPDYNQTPGIIRIRSVVRAGQSMIQSPTIIVPLTNVEPICATLKIVEARVFSSPLCDPFFPTASWNSCANETANSNVTGGAEVIGGRRLQGNIGEAPTTIAKDNIQLLSPNPFTNQLDFSITSPAAQTGSLQLYSFTGQRVATKSLKLVAGSNQVRLQKLGSHAAGTYVYRLVTEQGAISSGKVVKR